MSPRVLGFLTAATVPVLFGTRELVYWKTLAAEQSARQLPCGNPIAEALLIIFLIGPLLGFVGAQIAAVIDRRRAATGLPSGSPPPTGGLPDRSGRDSL